MEKDLTHGNTLKLIISFCIPLIGGAIFQQLYNVVDTMIVGRFVGVDALAAVGSTGSYWFCFRTCCWIWYSYCSSFWC